MTNGPPLAICSPIGFPDISKNLAFVKAVTFKFSPLDNNINVESLTLSKFQGVVIHRKGAANTETFTVRKMASGIGVERVFPVASPLIENIEVNKRGKVRRARIYYLRELTGKAARIKERRVVAKK